ncbi:glyoxalase superfamily protein, partial [Acinetobacter sp. UBA1496]|uniref:glyoxalase superfamily protein n=1 Tax=Acinetobacter sp. UBA1496 TaxID=1945926 RepID=UPI00257A291B
QLCATKPCKELNQKNYKFAKPGIQDMPWGSKNMSIADPFGNNITFTNAIST